MIRRTLSFLLLATALGFRTGAAEEFVVRLSESEPAVRATETGPNTGARRAAEGLRARGLRPLRSLGEGVMPERAVTLPRSRTPRSPFGLDAERTWLVETDSATAAGLATDRSIEWIERVQMREPVGFPADVPPDDPFFLNTLQWGLWNAGPTGVFRGKLRADIHAPEAWRMTTGSNHLLLAIADTGVDPDHPELGGLMPDGRPRIAFPFNSTLEPAVGVYDSFGHGTPVAGVFAARTNNGACFDTSGVAGVAGGDDGANAGCRLVPIRITTGRTGEAGSFDIARAILHAARVGARAMNLSFAGSGSSRVEREALHYAITHGCVVVAASGNRGTSAPTAPQYPAAHAAEGLCIQVGATDPLDRRAAFSSYGVGLDLMAPGTSIWTTFMTYRSAAGVLRNGYAAGSGTSFAAPHVTGAAGLLAAWRPELQDTDFQNLLRESADDIGAPGVDRETGWGRLNAARALESIPPTFGIWHDEAAAGLSRVLHTGNLVVGEPGPGRFTPPRMWPDAQLLEVEAIVAIPDSFVDSVRVWPRVGGTMTLRGDFRLPYFTPYAELVAINDRTFTLRGYLYRAACDGCTEPQDLPLPLDQARIGFTVIGKVDRLSRRRRVVDSEVRVAPNPMNAFARFQATSHGRLDILDVRGRRMRTLAAGVGGHWEWDGRDDSGLETPPGIYFARVEGGRATARFVRLGEARPIVNAPRVRP